MAEDQDHLERNLDSVLEVQRREREAMTAPQRAVEQASRVIGRPRFLIIILVFVLAWISLSSFLPMLGTYSFDPFPYPLLDGVISLVALIITTVILIAQGQQTRSEQQHAHIGLQVNLLTEQKVTKLIELIEELRRDMPNVRDRVDPQVEQMNKQTDAAQLHTAINDAGLTHEIVEEAVSKE